MCHINIANTIRYSTNPKSLFSRLYLFENAKEQVYTALVFSTFLCGCEVRALRDDLFQQLRSFHNRYARRIFRIGIAQNIRLSIDSKSSFRRLIFLDLDRHYQNLPLR
jgi:hypothetical protein